MKGVIEDKFLIFGLSELIMNHFNLISNASTQCDDIPIHKDFVNLKLQKKPKKGMA